MTPDQPAEIVSLTAPFVIVGSRMVSRMASSWTGWDELQAGLAQRGAILDNKMTIET